MKTAGLTHGGFYAHFDSRNALLAEALVRALEASEGGRNLLREGFPQDIATAAQIDRFDVLPRLTWPDGIIRPAR